jgi:hypothetical protein
MPTYIVSNTFNNVLGGTGDGGCANAVVCRDTTKFFDKLATKLKEMAESVNKRIEDIRKNAVCYTGGGVLFASIDVPTMNLEVKYEYIEYIKRYGPPLDGIFDESKLALLRNELAL